MQHCAVLPAARQPPLVGRVAAAARRPLRRGPSAPTALITPLGGESARRAAAQPAAALPAAVAAAAGTVLPSPHAPTHGFVPPAQQQLGYANNVQMVTREQLHALEKLHALESAFNASALAAAAPAPVAPPAPSVVAEPELDLEDFMNLLDDMESLTADLDSAVESTSELSDFTVGGGQGRQGGCWRACAGRACGAGSQRGQPAQLAACLASSAPGLGKPAVGNKEQLAACSPPTPPLVRSSPSAAPLLAPACRRRTARG